MQEPAKGLENYTNKNGLMKISLYSKIGRQALELSRTSEEKSSIK